MTPGDENSRQRIQTEKPASPSAIQAEKPLPPWEMPGWFRRDCESHRAQVLYWLAATSLVLTLFSWLLWGLPAFVTLPLSLITLLVAQCDLVRMRKGSMDPRGEDRTREARDLCLIVWGICCLAAGIMTFYWYMAG